MACLQVFSRSPVAVDGTVCTKPGACPCRHLLNRRLVLQHKKQLKRPYYLQTAQAAVSAPTETLQAPQQSPKQLLLPDGLNKHVVQLIFTRDNKPVHVYILGMSHVSRHSCTHVSQLIATVKPELVLLELCKDRVGLLIDPELPQPLYWHSRSVRLECSTAQQPSVQRACDSLLRKLQCQPGKAFSAYQIEQDCAQLLSSGLFKSVVPVTQSASATDAPMFVYSNNQLTTVAPLASLTFRASLREIPVVQSLKLLSTPEQKQADIESKLQQAESQQHRSALHKLVDLHEQLQEAMTSPTSISFQGLQLGEVTVHVKAAGSQAEASLTGLESTAKSGKGWGIQPFQHRAPKVPSLHAERHTPSGSSPPAGEQARQTELTPWPQQGKQQANNLSSQTGAQQNSISNRFAEFLTTRYGRSQAEAGRKVGVQAGEAWRLALLAAAQHGALQVQLIDKPAVAMSQRLSEAIWNSTLPYLAGALGLAVAALVGSASHVAPIQAEAVAAFGAAGLLAKGVLPVVGPLLEVQQLSKLSREEIEAAVDPKEQLQDSHKTVKLWGEDALLDWPGAMNPVIHERDAHMAQAIWAAASGTAGSPTYAVTSNQSEDQTWQYAMPKQAVDAAACPVGHGNGTFTLSADVRSLVATVGTAHVYGIMKHLEALQTRHRQS